MRTKTKQQGAAAKRGKVKVGKLELNKETIKDIPDKDQKKIKGGNRVEVPFVMKLKTPGGGFQLPS